MRLNDRNIDRSKLHSDRDGGFITPFGSETVCFHNGNLGAAELRSLSLRCYNFSSLLQ